jgi:hypothetical protein
MKDTFRHWTLQLADTKSKQIGFFDPFQPNDLIGASNDKTYDQEVTDTLIVRNFNQHMPDMLQHVSVGSVTLLYLITALFRDSNTSWRAY